MTPVDTHVSIRTVPPQRLADLVGEQLRRLIARGEFPQDCKLPSEGELCRRFGVSRPVLRDALGRLKTEGVLRSQQGSGTVVVRGASQGARQFPPIRTVADLLRSYEFRITVETATAALAAMHRSPAALQDVERTLAEAEEALASAATHLLADLNFKFHRAIAAAAANPFFVTTVEMIPNFIGRDQLGASTFGHTDALERGKQVHVEHTGIFEAIRARDPTRARAEMERHIALARDLVLERQELRLLPGSAAPQAKRRPGQPVAPEETG